MSASGGTVINGTATPAGAEAFAQAGDITLSGSATIAATGAQAQAQAGSATASGATVISAEASPTGAAATSLAGGVAVSASAAASVAGVVAQALAGAMAAAASGAVEITSAQAQLIYQIALLHGLDPANPLTVSASGRSAGTLIQTITGNGPVVIHTVSAPPLSGDAGAWIEALAALHGLTDDLTVTDSSRAAGAISQTLATDGATTTVETA